VPGASAWLFNAGYQLFDLAGGSNVLAGAAAERFGAPMAQVAYAVTAMLLLGVSLARK